MSVPATDGAAQFGGEREKVPFALRLYVAGSTQRSLRAIRNLTRFVRDSLPGATLEIIDICEQQQRAVADNIVAVPTLVKYRPGPTLVLLGDLSDSERLKSALGTDSYAP